MPPRYRPYGLDLQGGDPSARPGNDFFRRVNGRWFDTTEIPADRASAGSFYDLKDEVERRTRDVLERGPTGEGVTDEVRPDAVKIGAFYRAFMDVDRVELLGAAPISPFLSRIEASSREELVDLQGEAFANLGPALFALAIASDSKAPDRYAVTLGQGGIGLPDREYYRDRAFVFQRSAYAQYIVKLLGLAGWPDPEGAAAAILAFESEVAEASLAAAARRDSEALYNPTSVGELERETAFPFRRLLDRAGLGKVERVVVLERSAIGPIAAVWARTPVETLRAWHAFRTLDAAAPYLSASFLDAHAVFRDTVLEGIVKQPPRWQRGVRTVSAELGETVGKVYVARYFPPSARAEIEVMMGHIRQAMAIRIEGNTWMEPATKARALEKLSKVRFKLGFPDRWRDVSALRIEPDDLVGNVRRSRTFEWLRQAERLDRPVDRDEWSTTPQTVNAYYEPTMNDITVPAAYLGMPNFHPEADPAVNYGAIGASLGHELTHGFDDDGRRFDATGRLVSWWSDRDAAEFTARAARLGRQYDAFEIFPGVFVNGALTMGENIADLGGALVALDAYRLSLAGREPPVLDGLTGVQRFFVSYAQSWRGKTTEPSVRRWLVSDPHAPDAIRVNGVVRNMDGWYDAFAVGEGDKLYVSPDARVRLW